MRKDEKTSGSATVVMFAGVAFGVLTAFVQPVLAAPGSRYTACAACAPQELAWAEGEFDQVHLVAAPPGTRNQHPQVVQTEMLTRTLAALRAGNGTAPVLDPDAAASLAQGLAKALAKAGPQQDAIFMVTSKTGGGVLGPRLGNSGRAFVDAEGLNLIFGEAQVEFIGRYRATRMERPFDFGNRERPSKVTIAGDNATSRRSDWVVIPLAAAANASAGTPRLTAPVAPAAAPTAVPVQARDEQYYLAQEARLKALKRLRDQNLIDEQEYQAKRGEILKVW